MAETNLKKFMDRGGVSVLWSKVAEKVKAEEDRAKLAEQAALEAAQAAQADVDALEKLVGVLPEGTTATDVVDYVNKKTAGIATDAALAELQGQLSGAQEAIDAIEADYLKAADKTELQGNIDTLSETVSILSEGIDPDKVDGVKDLIKYVDEHGTEVTGMKEDISANADAIVALQAEDVELGKKITALEEKFDGEGSVSNLIAAAKQEAIDAAAGDATTKANAAEANAKAHAEEKATAAQTAAIEAAAADATAKANAAKDTAEANAKAYADGLAVNYDAAGAAGQALVDAKAYSDANLVTAKAYTDTAFGNIQALTEAEILAAIAEVNA